MTKFAVFLFSIICGMITRSGMMTYEQLILAAWDSTSYSLLFSLDPDLHIYILIAGVVVFVIVAYYFLEPFIFGLEHGSEGLCTAILGFIIGLFLMGVIIDSYYRMMGFPT